MTQYPQLLTCFFLEFMRGFRKHIDSLQCNAAAVIRQSGNEFLLLFLIITNILRTLSLIECFLLKYDYSTGCIIFAKPSHILLKGSDCIYIFPVFFKNVVTIVLQCDLISTWIYLLFKENAAWYKMMNRYVLYISVSI